MGVYIYQSGTEKELKNAYIGEVYEYSYDFRGKTIAGIQSDGWIIVTGAPSVSENYGIRGDVRISKDIGQEHFINAKNIKLEYKFTLDSSSAVSGRIAKTVSSSLREGLTGTYFSSGDGSYLLTIYDATTSYSGTTSGTKTNTISIDLVNKTFISVVDGMTTRTLSLTDTQITNIKNNTSKRFLFTVGSGTNYGIQTVSIKIE